MPFLQYLSVNASMLTMLAIGVERLVVICLPLRAKFYCTKRNMLTTTFGIWFVCIFASMPSFVFSSTKEEVYEISNSTNISITVCYTQQAGQEWYILSQIVLFYILPGLLLLIIYVLISRSLFRHSSNPSTEIVLVRPVVVARRTEAKRQLHFMFVAVVLAYFLCLLPFNVILVISVIDPNALQSVNQLTFNVMLSVVRVLFFFNSCINPILYNAVSENFRTAFCRLFGIHYYNRQNSDDEKLFNNCDQQAVVRSPSPSPRLKAHLNVCANSTSVRSSSL